MDAPGEEDDETILELDYLLHELEDSDFDYTIGDLAYDDAEEEDDEEDLDEILYDELEDSMKWQ